MVYSLKLLFMSLEMTHIQNNVWATVFSLQNVNGLMMVHLHVNSGMGEARSSKKRKVTTN